MASPNQLSFLPDDYLERKQRRRTNLICASLFVVVVGSVFGAFSITQRSLGALEAEYTATDSQYTEAAKRIELVREMREKQVRMATQAELTAGLLERVPRSHVLAEITNAMPAGVSLLELDMQSKVRPPPPPPAPAPGATVSAADAAKAAIAAANAQANDAKVYDVGMKLQGVALTDMQVASFITKLGKSAMFKDVNLVISEEYKVDEQKCRKFSIEVMLDPAARVLADGTKLNASKDGAKEGGAK